MGHEGGLARGIADALRGPDMSAACRAYAESHLDYGIQAAKYEDSYHDLAIDHRPAPPIFRVPDAPPETTGTLIRLLDHWLIPAGGDADETDENNESSDEESEPKKSPDVATTSLQEALELARWYHDITQISATPPTLRCFHALDRHQGRLPGPQFRRPTPSPR